MSWLHRRLDSFFERHPRLRRLDRDLGTVLFLLLSLSGAGAVGRALGGPVVLQVAVTAALFACPVWALADEIRGPSA